MSRPSSWRSGKPGGDLASALTLAGLPTIVATWDLRLLRAARSVGLHFPHNADLAGRRCLRHTGRMAADPDDAPSPGRCATCGGDLPVWPHASVPQGDGSWLRYHEGCEPWRHPDVPPGEPTLPIPAHWRPALSAVIDRLVGRDYLGVVRDGFVPHADGPDDATIGEWIEQYPATLVALPDEAWAVADRGRCVDDPDAWWVVIPLWTAEEGQSDLGLEAVVREDDGYLRIALQNVHVM